MSGDSSGNDRRDFMRAASTLPLTAVAAATSLGAAGPAFASDTPGAPALSSTRASGASSELNFAAVVQQPLSAYRLRSSPRNLLNLDAASQANWREVKRALVASLSDSPSDPIVNWLSTFDQNFDDRAAAAVMAAAQGLARPGAPDQYIYEPQLYDGWLRSAASLLDRCLAYRREMGGFEVDGINAGLEYLAFIRSNPIARNVIGLASQSDIARIQEVSQAKAAGLYSSRIELEHVANGHAAASTGASQAAGRTVEKEVLRNQLQLNQFDINSEVQLAKFTRFITPGSASNFAERYLRLNQLFTEDLSDAFKKVFCSAIGLSRVMGFTSVPNGASGSIAVAIPLYGANVARADVDRWVSAIFQSANSGQAANPERLTDVVDALVLWTRAMLRELDRISQYESEFTVSIPLNQMTGNPARQIVDSTYLKNQITSATGKTFSVDAIIKQSDLPFDVTFNQLRIVAIGLSVVHDISDGAPVEYTPGFPVSQPNQQTSAPGQTTAAEIAAEPKLARLNAMVRLPAQSNDGAVSQARAAVTASRTTAATRPAVAAVASSGYSRPPVMLPNVRIQGGIGGDLEPVLSGDPACRNASPFGKWTISIDKKDVVWYSGANTPLTLDTWMNGMILTLRLRGTAA